MEFSLSTFSPAQDDLLRRYGGGGGVLDFLLYRVGQSSDEEVHRAVAIAGFNEVVRRTNQEYGREMYLSDSFTFLEGRPLSIPEFMGDRFDFQSASFPDSNAVGDGFAYAFLCPPYGLTISTGSSPCGGERKFFLSFCATVLGGPETNATIFSWDTDFSGFFDPGREWWGTFFWTQEIPSQSEIVVIVGSATD